MRRHAALALALSSALVGGPTPAAPPDAPAAVAATAPDLAGRWKLTVLVQGDDEFLLADLKSADGKVTGTVANAQPFLGPLETVEVGAEGERLSLRFTGGGDMVFRGVPARDGTILGAVRLRGTTYPARLEKTEARQVARLRPSPLRQKLLKARGVKDANERVAGLLALIQETPGHPMNVSAYSALLQEAGAAGLGPDEVRARIERWTEEARPYGPDWTSDVQIRALKAIQGNKAYAPLATELALAAEKALPADAPLEQRGTLAALLARSARLADRGEVAAEAESRVRAIDGRLDDEYRAKVPPFKPEPYAGRGAGKEKADRVVLMEIFTGAECPPCVAADVAFDALRETYRSTEFIGLQHHLHIPGPDPLTNPDTVARQGYYGQEVRGTPSTFFNGKPAGGGGGGMDDAKGKYDEFRGAIEPALSSGKQAEIRVTAARAGDELKIEATARAVDPDAKKAAGEARPKLRLVLVEESVRYPGGNKLRFHHNVVRAFPGGVEGKALEKGEANVETTVKLSDLRKAQDEYNAQYPSSTGGRAFPYPLPPMALDELAVVALIQDDADHGVWHAVQVPVKVKAP
jgi:hypothetical protein